MTTPTWQPGTLYAPGALVVPRTKPSTTMVQPSNPGFETGDLTGWTTADPARWAVLPSQGGDMTPFAGSYFAQCSGTGTTALVSSTYAPIKPGQRATVTANGKITNSGVDHAAFQAILEWHDDAGTLLSYVAAPSRDGKGGFWTASTASGIAPPNATQFRIVLSTYTADNCTVEWDAVSYHYDIQLIPDGLVYEATQAAAGRSGSSEPAWPGNTSTPVTDNQVTWNGKIASRVVWKAAPICRTGTTEPVWPTEVGGRVSDGVMAWEAISRRVEDTNCPNSKVVAIMASKVFAADGDIVRFSATVNPLDWTSPNDAGYLPTGLQQANANAMAVLAPYRSNLTALNASSFQNWQVDPDPAAMALLDQMEGIGSTEQAAAQPVGNDLFYLAQLGVRSVSLTAGTENLKAGDVGMPIDSLVQASLRVARLNDTRVLSTYYPSAGQYWLVFHDADPLAISGSLPDGINLDPVDYQYSLTGGVGTKTASIVSGALPPGVSMDSSGHLTGTLSTAGSYSWTVQVTDADGTTVTLADSCAVASTDIVNFATANDGIAQTPYHAAVADPVILVGANNGYLLVSSDEGVTWTVRSGFFSGAAVWNVARFNGRWYIFDGSLHWQSAGDDLVFSAKANTSFSTSPSSAQVANGALFVGQYNATTSTLWRMDTTETWASHSLGGSYGDPTSIVWTGTAYLVGTSTGKVLRSTDLVSWTQVHAFAAGNTNARLAELNGVVVACVSGGNWSRSTDDGVTWSADTNVPTLGYLTATRTMFIGGRTLAVRTSTDGLSWTTAYTATAGASFSAPMATDGAVFVAPIQSGYSVVGTNA